jgi:SulP family sulfate permease
MGIKSYLPFLQWVKTYNSGDFKGDLSAGLTVGVMLIPQGMAYSMLAGLPPIYGLYASTLPLIVYALLGTSRQLAVGPVAMVALLISAGISPLAEVGSAEYVKLAILLALMVGLFQFLMGVFRLGFIVNFLSHPVISGFTSAAALIIGLSQLKHLLGINLRRSNHIHKIIGQAIERIDELHVPTLILGATAIAVILVIKRINKRIPGPLIVVILGILAVYFLKLDEAGMKILKEVPSGFPQPSLPLAGWETMNSLIPTVLAISLVGFMESIAVAKAIQARHRNYEVVPNQELIGLGAANILGSFFSSFPVTGGFSRTAVNDQAGARTGLASIISAVLIILTLLFLTPLFYYLPKAILASIIMVAVFGLIDTKEAIHLWKHDKKDFAMLLVTLIATLSLGIEEGILLGVVLSLAIVVKNAAYPHVAKLGQIIGTDVFRNTDRFPDALDPQEILIVRPDSPLFFANINYVKERWENWEAEKGEGLKCVILHAKGITSLDSSAVHYLEEVVKEYQSKGIAFYMTGVLGPVRDLLHHNGLVDKWGSSMFHAHVMDAYNAFRGEKTSIDTKITLQTNG